MIAICRNSNFLDNSALSTSQLECKNLLNFCCHYWDLKFSLGSGFFEVWHLQLCCKLGLFKKSWQTLQACYIIFHQSRKHDRLELLNEVLDEYSGVQRAANVTIHQILKSTKNHLRPVNLQPLEIQGYVLISLSLYFEKKSVVGLLKVCHTKIDKIMWLQKKYV